MGKQLIIKGADFSENAIEQIKPVEVYIPQVVQAESATDNWISDQYSFTLTDDANELVGKTIIGFDLHFVNKASGATMGARITFNPNGAESIICNISCSFATQDVSEEKIVHYDLSTPYTFKNNDVLSYAVTGATFVNAPSDTRGGCVFARIDRPNNVVDGSFLLSANGSMVFSQFSYQPFMKLYLV